MYLNGENGDLLSLTSSETVKVYNEIVKEFGKITDRKEINLINNTYQLMVLDNEIEPLQAIPIIMKNKGVSEPEARNIFIRICISVANKLVLNDRGLKNRAYIILNKIKELSDTKKIRFELMNVNANIVSERVKAIHKKELKEKIDNILDPIKSGVTGATNLVVKKIMPFAIGISILTVTGIYLAKR